MEENIGCEQCSSSFNKMFLLGKQGNTDICPVCGGKLSPSEAKEQDGWITWYYYKNPKYGDYSLWDKLPNDPNALTLIKEFKAPPRDLTGSSDSAKEVLRTHIPDAFTSKEESTPIIRCPRCGSKEYTLLNKGYSLFTGVLGSKRVKRICNYCKKDF